MTFYCNATDFRAFTRQWENGEFPNQRFGQAFVNHFGIECSRLDGGECIFYMDNLGARRHIQENYVDWSQ